LSVNKKVPDLSKRDLGTRQYCKLLSSDFLQSYLLRWRSGRRFTHKMRSVLHSPDAFLWGWSEVLHVVWQPTCIR